MLKVYETYAPRALPADANYPLGSIKNVSVPGAKDGTPLDNRWGNNIEGFHQALLADAGIAANGQVDKVGSSQLLDSIKIIFNKVLVFTQNGIGAISRSMQSKMRDIVNVRDFGALGDGTGRTPADDGKDISSASWNVWPWWVTPANYGMGAQTSSGTNGHYYGDGTAGWYITNKPFSNSDSWDFIGIQLAIWACAAQSGATSGNVVVPSGSYKITKTIQYTGPCRATLIGDGRLTTGITAKDWTTFPLTFVRDLPTTAKKKVLLYFYRTGGIPTDIMMIGFTGPGTQPMGQGTSIDPILTAGAYAGVVFDNADTITLSKVFFSGMTEFSMMASDKSGIKLDDVTSEYAWFALWSGVGCSIEARSIGFYQSYPSGYLCNGIRCDDATSSIRMIDSRITGFVGRSITWKNNAQISDCEISAGVNAELPILIENDNQLTGNKITYKSGRNAAITMLSRNIISENKFDLSGGWAAVVTNDASASVLAGYNAINGNTFKLAGAISFPVAGALITGQRLYASSYISGGEYNVVGNNVSTVSSGCLFGGSTHKIANNVNF